MTEPLLVDDLPRFLAYDSGVLIRALGAKSAEPISRKCVELWKVGRQSGVIAYVPAMVLTEMIRGGPERPPRDDQTVAIPFDEAAAEFAGKTFPEAWIRLHAGEHEVPIHYVKYDALIVACAKRHGAGAIVSMDEGLRRLAARADLKAYSVEDLVTEAPQAPLPLQVDLPLAPAKK